MTDQEKNCEPDAFKIIREYKKNPLLYLNYSECSQPQIFPKKSQKF